MPPSQAAGVAEVVVCHPECDDPDGPSWIGSGLLEIGVRVPDVRGGSLADAEIALGERGLVAAADPETADDDSTVDQQDPQPGVVVTLDSTVTLALATPALTLLEVPGVLEQSGQPTPPSPSPPTPEVSAPDEGEPEGESPAQGQTQVDTPSQVQTPPSAETPTSAAAAAPTEPPTVIPTDQAEVDTVDESMDWRGAGLTVSAVVLAAVAAFVAGGAVTGGRRGTR